MNFGRWVELVYNESDIGKGIGTTAAGIAGLTTYLYWRDWVVAAFATIIVFPVARILASATHSHLAQSRKRRYGSDQIKELFGSLGREERDVVQAFVWHGGSVITWGQFNASPDFSSVGIESLIGRKLAHVTVTADGMTEAFALDTQLFDYAQTVLPDVPF